MVLIYAICNLRIHIYSILKGMSKKLFNWFRIIKLNDLMILGDI